MIALEFTVPGKITGANRVKTTVRMGAHNRTITTASGRHDLSRIYQIAWAAAQAAKWHMPDACAVQIVAWNSRLDCDATPKITMDAMIGVVYADDRIVIELAVQKRLDAQGERYDVRIEPRDALQKPKPLVRMRFDDVPHEWLAVLANASTCHSQATVSVRCCHPMRVCDMPVAWRARAAKALKAGIT